MKFLIIFTILILSVDILACANDNPAINRDKSKNSQQLMNHKCLVEDSIGTCLIQIINKQNQLLNKLDTVTYLEYIQAKKQKNIYEAMLSPTGWEIAGVFASFFAICIALLICSIQIKNEQRSKKQEHKEIGETIRVLMEQLNVDILAQLSEYKETIKAQQVRLTQPVVVMIPMGNIERLRHFGADILYKVFRYFNISLGDYQSFFYSLDYIAESFRLVLINLQNADNKYIAYLDEFIELRRGFGKYINPLISTLFEKGGVRDFWIKAAEDRRFNNLDENEWYVENLLNPLYQVLEDTKKENSPEMNELHVKVADLLRIYNKVLLSNNNFTNYLKDLVNNVEQNRKILEIISQKLN